MAKGTVVAVVTVGAVVLLGGGAIALAVAASRRSDMMLPLEPGPPPPPSVAEIGKELIKAGLDTLSELEDEKAVKVLTDGEDIPSYLLKGHYTGGMYYGYQAVKGGLRAIFGSSKVCRCNANNKDVFPNDMEECAKRGITDCQACGRLFDLATFKWPWTA